MNGIFMAITVILLFCSITSFGQEEVKVKYLVVTTMHVNLDKEDMSMDEWKALEKEYMEKVTSKNEYVAYAGWFSHLMTADSREAMYIQTYKTWEDIDKAGKRTEELEKEAWPDEKVRKDFLKEQQSYFTDFHSDEIYNRLSGAKVFTELEKDMVMYMRTSTRAFPSDGTSKEFEALRKKVFANIINKNEYIKAYYPSEHAWGADRRDFNEAFYLDSLSDLEKMLDRSAELAKDALTKEEWKAFSKYFTGVHGDYLYTAIKL